MGCRRAFRHPNLRVIFQNPDDRAVFIRKGIVTGEQAAVIKGSGVDLSLYRPSSEPEGLPIVILASRMLWDKGVAQFVEAALILKSVGVQARFALAGEPDPENPATIPHEQLEVWRESGEIEWWGLQEPENMPGVLAKSHIVCLPSYREGIPRILIEAAASGRPIVTTDAPGCRELVRPGVNGIIVPSRDASSLAGALRFLIENPEARIAMGANNREVAVQEFSQELVIAQFMSVYRDLLRAASLGPTAPGQAHTAAKERLRTMPGSALPAQLRSQGRS
jgi:glycosyltransferase involved in cell wall biosynthesis